MNAKETIEVINKTYDNTKFIIEKEFLFRRIYEVIHSWITVLFFAMLFYCYLSFISQMTGFFGKNLYYIIYNILFHHCILITTDYILYKIKETIHHIKKKDIFYIYFI